MCSHLLVVLKNIYCDVIILVFLLSNYIFKFYRNFRNIARVSPSILYMEAGGGAVIFTTLQFFLIVIPRE
jgi:hypothetical protein